MNKNRTERDTEIFNLWYYKKKSFTEIAAMDHNPYLSYSRIKNIVYAGPRMVKNDYSMQVYKLFRIKFLEFQDIGIAINWIVENQPKRRYSERYIKMIISSYLKSNSKTPAL